MMYTLLLTVVKTKADSVVSIGRCGFILYTGVYPGYTSSSNLCNSLWFCSYIPLPVLLIRINCYDQPVLERRPALYTNWGGTNGTYSSVQKRTE